MRQIAQACGLRLTPQRLAILEVLRSTDIHPEASWIYQQVRKRLPAISLGTVYRNLALLADAGLIRELALGDQMSHWDGRVAPHYHVVCARCHRIADIELPGTAEELERRAAIASDFVIQGHSLQFVGRCPRCQEELDAVIQAH